MKIRFDFGDVMVFIAITLRIIMCIEDGYISTSNLIWLIALITIEALCLYPKLIK